MNEINIGTEIAKVAKTRRMNAAFIAKKLGVARSNMNHIFKRKTIDTDLLYKLSMILDFNFFDLYSGSVRKNMGLEHGMAKEADMATIAQVLQSHEKNASAQNEYIDLLEKKISLLRSESGTKKRKK